MLKEKTLYLAVNDKWHIAIRNKASCSGIKLSDSAHNYTVGSEIARSRKISVYLKNICHLCYTKHRSYINKKIIEYKLGIKQ